MLICVIKTKHTHFQNQSPHQAPARLVFATLMQASERWQNVRMSEVEVAMLKQLRRQLGLESPAAEEQPEVQAQAV